MEKQLKFEVGGKEYVADKFKPTEGRRIVAGYPITAMPKVGSYDDNEALMLRLMSHVSVVTPGGLLRLTTMDLVNNHVESWEHLVEIEYKVLRFNCPFMNPDNLRPFTQMIQGLASEYIVGAINTALGQFGLSPQGLADDVAQMGPDSEKSQQE